MNEGTQTYDRFLSLRSEAARTLDAVPLDRWVPASEIAEAVGLTSNKVGGVIGSQLKGVYVERRQKSPYKHHYLYRRLPRVIKSQRLALTPKQ